MPLRLSAACFECHRAGLTTEPQLVALNLQTTGPYEFTCPNGHRGVVVIQQFPFQLLYDLGIEAMLDGYPREAVADFAAALERYHEFFATAAGLALQLPPAELETTWKTVAKQSERQLGLFAGLHLALHGVAGRLLPRSMVELRNEVVHSGHIPSESKAINFGQAVANLLISGVADLWNRCPKVMENDVVWRHLNKQSPAPEAEVTRSTLHHPVAISTFKSPSQLSFSLADEIVTRRKRRMDEASLGSA